MTVRYTFASDAPVLKAEPVVTLICVSVMFAIGMVAFWFVLDYVDRHHRDEGPLIVMSLALAVMLFAMLGIPIAEMIPR